MKTKLQRRSFLMQLKPLSLGKLQDWMVYQTFVDILRGPLLACFNHSYKNDRLSDTQQEVLISFLLKQDTSGKYKDPVCHDFCRSWLPCLFGRCSAVVVTGLLSATDPFFVFCLFCLISCTCVFCVCLMGFLI